MSRPPRHVAHFTQPIFKCRHENIPTILVNISHTCHVGFHIDFHPPKMLWNVVQNCPHANLKQGPMTLSTNGNSRILKSHDLLGFCVSVPLAYSRSFEMNHQQAYKGEVSMLDGWEVHSYTTILSLRGNIGHGQVTTINGATRAN